MWRFAALLVVVAFAGCGGSNDGGEASNKLVVAAFYPLAWAAGQIASPDADVVNLTPPGAEPHDVELSPGDVESVHDADLVLYLGGGFQPALEHALAGRSGRSVDLLEDRTLRKGSGTEGDATADPHVWLDPRLFAGIVREIGRALGRPEPAAELAVKLRTLDRELQAGLERCERREIVTSHAAFGYLARRYGLEQIALTGLSPGAEPSPGDLVRLVDAVRASGATTVFFETLVPPDLAETVAREAGAKTAVLDPLEGLTQAELDAGEDYFSVMRANLAALRKALGCP
jgi:zinc transport system substrate-binding protein